MTRLVTLYLEHSASLVLYDALSEAEDSPRSLNLQDPAVAAALTRLHAALERELVDPLDRNYVDLVIKAREELLS